MKTFSGIRIYSLHSNRMNTFEHTKKHGLKPLKTFHLVKTWKSKALKRADLEHRGLLQLECLELQFLKLNLRKFFIYDFLSENGGKDFFKYWQNLGQKSDYITLTYNNVTFEAMWQAPKINALLILWKNLLQHKSHVIESLNYLILMKCFEHPTFENWISIL